MIKRMLSIRPTIFAGLLIFAVLSLAACSPVAIMMPQAGATNQSALPGPGTSSYGAGEIDVAATPYLMAYSSRAEEIAGLETASSQVSLDQSELQYVPSTRSSLESLAAVGQASSQASLYQSGLQYVPSTKSSLESLAAAEPLLKVAKDSKLGEILVDGKGMTLYIFTKDEADKSNCAGDCLAAWPPLLAVDNPVVGEGIDASLLGTANLPDGSKIVTYNHMPLYYWQGDTIPGDTNGQGKNGVWFVVSPVINTGGQLMPRDLR